jgi:HEAT repeat protein
MGPAAESAVPVLARAAASSDAAVAGQASIALSAVGAPAGLWLAAALSSANPASRAGAAKVLSALTPPPAEAAEALLGALEDADEKVREHAAMALASYPAKPLFPLPVNFIPALTKAAEANDAAAGWARTALAKAGMRLPGKEKERDD